MSVSDDPARRCVVTIGNFDGVHRGHLAVVTAARGLAGTDPVKVVTFAPHPLLVLRPDQAPPVLTPLPEKIRLLLAAGADEVVVLEFDQALARMSPAEFVRVVLVQRLRARVVVVGENFRFGHRAAGDVALLRRLGASAGFAVVPAPLATVPDGSRVSSSSIRERLAAGDVEAVQAALGRPMRLFGLVVHGDARGRAMGYPTANLDVSDGVQGPVAVPGDGIYAVRLLSGTELDGAPPAAGPDGADGAHRVPGLPATLSVGTNPTFGGVERRIEAHVLDRDDLELYGVRVALDLVARQRPTLRFDSAGALITQMAADTDLTRELLALPVPHGAAGPSNGPTVGVQRGV